MQNLIELLCANSIAPMFLCDYLTYSNSRNIETHIYKPALIRISVWFNSTTR
jgi:hypothetical protein